MMNAASATDQSPTHEMAGGIAVWETAEAAD
jgi:hypothetical protein